MGCNCSNTQVGYVMDLLNLVLADMGGDLRARARGTQGERRAAYLQDKMKALCIPVSADSIPTKGAQEDHVEFSYSAACKFAESLELLEQLVITTNKMGA